MNENLWINDYFTERKYTMTKICILVKRSQLFLRNLFIEKNEIFRLNKEASSLVRIIDQSEFIIY